MSSEDRDADERAHGLFDGLRRSVVRVSDAFAASLGERLARTDQEKGPGVDTIVGGLLVEALNMLSSAVGVEAAEEDDGDD